MTEEDEIFQKLKQGLPWDQIAPKAGKASLYRALDRYFEWANNELNLTHQNIGKCNAKLEQSKNELTNLEEKLTAINLEVKKFEVKNKLINEEYAALVIKRDQLKNEYEGIQKQLELLNEKGVTKEIITQVSSLDIKNPEELFKRIDTVEKNDKLVIDKNDLELKLNAIDIELNNKKKMIEETKIEYNTLKSKLEELKQLYWTYSESQNIVVEAFQRGYDSNMQKSLYIGLKRLETPGQPKNSIKKALEIFEKIQSEDELDSQINIKQTKLKNIQTKIDEATGIFENYKELTLKAVNETVALSKNQIVAVRSVTEQQIKEIHDRSLKEIETFTSEGKAMIKSIQNISASERQALLTQWTNAMSLLWQNVYKTSTELESSLKKYKETIDEWGSIKEEAGKQEALLYYGTLLMAFVKDKSAISRIPPEIISVISERLQYWVQVNYPNMKIKAPTYLENELGLLRYYELSTTAISAWFNEMIKDITRRQQQ